MIRFTLSPPARLTAFLLACALALPAPAWALRQSSGQALRGEQSIHSGVEEEIRRDLQDSVRSGLEAQQGQDEATQRALAILGPQWGAFLKTLNPVEQARLIKDPKKVIGDNKQRWSLRKDLLKPNELARKLSRFEEAVCEARRQASKPVPVASAAAASPQAISSAAPVPFSLSELPRQTPVRRVPAARLKELRGTAEFRDMPELPQYLHTVGQYLKNRAAPIAASIERRTDGKRLWEFEAAKRVYALVRRMATLNDKEIDQGLEQNTEQQIRRIGRIADALTFDQFVQFIYLMLKTVDQGMDPTILSFSILPRILQQAGESGDPQFVSRSLGELENALGACADQAGVVSALERFLSSSDLATGVEAEESTFFLPTGSQITLQAGDLELTLAAAQTIVHGGTRHLWHKWGRPVSVGDYKITTLSMESPSQPLAFIAGVNYRTLHEAAGWRSGLRFYLERRMNQKKSTWKRFRFEPKPNLTKDPILVLPTQVVRQLLRDTEKSPDALTLDALLRDAVAIQMSKWTDPSGMLFTIRWASPNKRAKIQINPRPLSVTPHQPQLLRHQDRVVLSTRDAPAGGMEAHDPVVQRALEILREVDQEAYRTLIDHLDADQQQRLIVNPKPLVGTWRNIWAARGWLTAGEVDRLPKAAGGARQQAERELAEATSPQPTPASDKFPFVEQGLTSTVAWVFRPHSPFDQEKRMKFLRRVLEIYPEGFVLVSENAPPSLGSIGGSLFERGLARNLDHLTALLDVIEKEREATAEDEAQAAQALKAWLQRELDRGNEEMVLLRAELKQRTEFASSQSIALPPSAQAWGALLSHPGVVFWDERPPFSSMATFIRGTVNGIRALHSLLDAASPDEAVRLYGQEVERQYRGLIRCSEDRERALAEEPLPDAMVAHPRSLIVVTLGNSHRRLAGRVNYVRHGFQTVTWDAEEPELSPALSVFMPQWDGLLRKGSDVPYDPQRLLEELIAKPIDWFLTEGGQPAKESMKTALQVTRRVVEDKRLMEVVEYLRRNRNYAEEMARSHANAWYAEVEFQTAVYTLVLIWLKQQIYLSQEVARLFSPSRRQLLAHAESRIGTRTAGLEGVELRRFSGRDVAGGVEPDIYPIRPPAGSMPRTGTEISPYPEASRQSPFGNSHTLTQNSTISPTAAASLMSQEMGLTNRPVMMAAGSSSLNTSITERAMNSSLRSDTKANRMDSIIMENNSIINNNPLAGLEAQGRGAGEIAGIPWGNTDALAERVLEALERALSTQAALPEALSLSKAHLVELLGVESPALYAAEDRRPGLLKGLNQSLAKCLPGYSTLVEKGLREVPVEKGGGQLYSTLISKGIRWDNPEVVADRLLQALAGLTPDLPGKIFLNEKQARTLLKRPSVFRRGREQNPDFVFQVNSAIQARKQPHEVFREREVFVVERRGDLVDQIQAPLQSGHTPVVAWNEPESVALWILNRLTSVKELPRQIFLTQQDLAKILGVTRAAISAYFIHHPASRSDLEKALGEEFVHHPLHERRKVQILRLVEPFAWPSSPRVVPSAQLTSGLEADDLFQINGISVIEEGRAGHDELALAADPAAALKKRIASLLRSSRLLLRITVSRPAASRAFQKLGLGDDEQQMRSVLQQQLPALLVDSRVANASLERKSITLLFKNGGLPVQLSGRDLVLGDLTLVTSSPTDHLMGLGAGIKLFGQYSTLTLAQKKAAFAALHGYLRNGRLIPSDMTPIPIMLGLPNRAVVVELVKKMGFSGVQASEWLACLVPEEEFRQIQAQKLAERRVSFLRELEEKLRARIAGLLEAAPSTTTSDQKQALEHRRADLGKHLIGDLEQGTDLPADVLLSVDAITAAYGALDSNFRVLARTISEVQIPPVFEPGTQTPSPKKTEKQSFGLLPLVAWLNLSQEAHNIGNEEDVRAMAFRGLAEHNRADLLEHGRQTLVAIRESIPEIQRRNYDPEILNLLPPLVIDISKRHSTDQRLLAEALDLLFQKLPQAFPTMRRMTPEALLAHLKSAAVDEALEKFPKPRKPIPTRTASSSGKRRAASTTAPATPAVARLGAERLEALQQLPEFSSIPSQADYSSSQARSLKGQIMPIKEAVGAQYGRDGETLWSEAGMDNRLYALVTRMEILNDAQRGLSKGMEQDLQTQIEYLARAVPRLSLEQFGTVISCMLRMVDYGVDPSRFSIYILPELVRPDPQTQKMPAASVRSFNELSDRIGTSADQRGIVTALEQYSSRFARQHRHSGLEADEEVRRKAVEQLRQIRSGKWAALLKRLEEDPALLAEVIVEHSYGPVNRHWDTWKANASLKLKANDKGKLIADIDQAVSSSERISVVGSRSSSRSQGGKVGRALAEAREKYGSVEPPKILPEADRLPPLERPVRLILGRHFDENVSWFSELIEDVMRETEGGRAVVVWVEDASTGKALQAYIDRAPAAIKRLLKDAIVQGRFNDPIFDDMKTALKAAHQELLTNLGLVESLLMSEPSERFGGAFMQTIKELRAGGRTVLLQIEIEPFEAAAGFMRANDLQAEAMDALIERGEKNQALQLMVRSLQASRAAVQARDRALSRRIAELHGEHPALFHVVTRGQSHAYGMQKFLEGEGILSQASEEVERLRRSALDQYLFADDQQATPRYAEEVAKREFLSRSVRTVLAVRLREMGAPKSAEENLMGSLYELVNRLPKELVEDWFRQASPILGDDAVFAMQTLRWLEQQSARLPPEALQIFNEFARQLQALSGIGAGQRVSAPAPSAPPAPVASQDPLGAPSHTGDPAAIAKAVVLLHQQGWGTFLDALDAETQERLIRNPNPLILARRNRWVEEGLVQRKEAEQFFSQLAKAADAARRQAFQAGLETVGDEDSEQVLVVQAGVISRRVGLAEFVRRLPREWGLGRTKVMLVGKGSAAALEAAAANPGVITAVDSDQVDDWVVAAAGIEEAEKIRFVGDPAIGQQFAALVQRIIPRAGFVQIDPAAGMEAILRSLGLPDAALDEINAAGVEEMLARQHAA